MILELLTAAPTDIEKIIAEQNEYYGRTKDHIEVTCSIFWPNAFTSTKFKANNEEHARDMIKRLVDAIVDPVYLQIKSNVVYNYN